MDASYRHFYLYAKGHYHIGDIVEDLKQLVAERCCLNLDMISKKDVICVLTNAVKDFVKFEKFIDKFFEPSWMGGEEESVEVRMFQTMLSSIRWVEIKDIPFELGEADPKILPLRRKFE